VHTNGKRRLFKAKFVAISVTIPDDLVGELAYHPVTLPKDWSTKPAGSRSKNFGDRFLRAGGFPIMEVPSAAVSGDHCYLLNPLHPEFKKLEIGDPEPFSFDAGVLEKGR
jgi:RES domain-containing protein